jgi:hypothetical protein
MDVLQVFQHLTGQNHKGVADKNIQAHEFGRPGHVFLFVHAKGVFYNVPAIPKQLLIWPGSPVLNLQVHLWRS